MRYAVLLTTLLVLTLSACGKPATDAWAAGFANKVCPVEGGAVVTDDPALVVEYQGRKIGFCCAGCPQKFRRDPEVFMEKMRKDPTKYGYRD